ncbi:MAG: hypothetical protein MUO23_13365 [Anaerolineales bacterium]|nr:hypothetical protein [Anaerolineales bacterium]
MRYLPWIPPVLLLLTLSLPLQAASSQAQPAIDRLEVALWPEYDQPAMLVILRAELAPGTSLPAEITLPIPASAGEPLAVAYTTADGALLNAPYARQVQGDWALITLTTETPSAQLEYYQPLQISGAERAFTYEWPGGQDLANLSYEVQHPVGSEAMTIDPPPQSSQPRPDGLQYSLADLGPIPGTATQEIRLSYRRETSTLSVDTVGQPEPPVAGPAESGSGSLDVTAWLPAGLAVIGIGLVVGGGVLYWRSRRRSAVQSARERHRPSRAEVPASAASLDVSIVFCHSCGSQAGVSDPFCRQCGAKLRG